MDRKQPTKCPRCGSKRLNQRLSGENFCLRCGQRWSTDGLIIPSCDKRKITKKHQVPDKEQLPLVAS